MGCWSILSSNLKRVGWYGLRWWLSRVCQCLCEQERERGVVKSRAIEIWVMRDWEECRTLGFLYSLFFFLNGVALQLLPSVRFGSVPSVYTEHAFFFSSSSSFFLIIILDYSFIWSLNQTQRIYNIYVGFIQAEIWYNFCLEIIV